MNNKTENNYKMLMGLYIYIIWLIKLWSAYNHELTYIWIEEVHPMQIWQTSVIEQIILHFSFWSSVLSLCLPFDPYKVYTDVNGKETLLLCQAHLQELIPVQLFYRLVLKILEGVGKMGLVYLLQEVSKWQSKLRTKCSV